MSLPATWEVVSGEWDFSDGRLLGKAIGGGARLRLAPERSADFSVDCVARLTGTGDGPAWLGIAFGEFSAGGGGTSASIRHHGLGLGFRGEDTWLAHVVDYGDEKPVVRLGFLSGEAVSDGDDLRLRFEVTRGRARLFIDDELRLESAFASDAPPGEVSLSLRHAAADFHELRFRVLDEGEKAPESRVAAGQPRVIAHRGVSAVAPENTLAAIRLALALGVDGVEFDVQRTRDDVLVVFHDDDLLRTTNFRDVFPSRTDAEATIGQLTLAELERLDAGAWKGPAFVGEKIPTLRSVLAEMRGRSVPVVEIKEDRIGADVARLVTEMFLEDEVFVIGFPPGVVQEFGAAIPRATTGLNIHERDGEDPVERARSHIRRVREVGANAVVCHYMSVTPEYVEAFHNRGLAVWVYTVNEAALMDILAGMGVDGIITDVPDLALSRRPGASGRLAERATPGEAPGETVQRIEARPPRKETRVDILPGEIPLADLGRFLSDSTGLPVLYDTRALGMANQRVIVTAPIRDADYAVVKAILEANQILIAERELPGGQRILILDPATSPAGSSAGPVPTPIVVIRDSGVGAAVIPDSGILDSEKPGLSRVETGHAASEPNVPPGRAYGGFRLTVVPEVVRAQTDLQKGWGVLVAGLDPETPQRASAVRVLRPYDIVTHVERDPVDGPEELIEALEALPGGAKFQFRVLRGGVTQIIWARK